MSKKRVEPFNPWPGFVDLFASVIMVILIFMLVLIVNITYYAQFKFKIAYTGSVAVKELVTHTTKLIEEDTQKIKKEFLVEVDQKEQSKEEDTKDIEAVAGLNLNLNDTNITKQESFVSNNSITIKYSNKEIILDPKLIKDLDSFLKDKDFPNTLFEIYVQEPLDQVSSSISKQITLSRALNIRNAIRKQGFKEKQIAIKLTANMPEFAQIKYAPGYLLVVAKNKE